MPIYTNTGQTYETEYDYEYDRVVQPVSTTEDVPRKDTINTRMGSGMKRKRMETERYSGWIDEMEELTGRRWGPNDVQDGIPINPGDRSPDYGTEGEPGVPDILRVQNRPDDEDLYEDEDGHQRLRSLDRDLDTNYGDFINKFAKGMTHRDAELIRRYNREGANKWKKEDDDNLRPILEAIEEQVKNRPSSQYDPATNVINMTNWPGLLMDRVLKKYREYNPGRRSSLDDEGPMGDRIPVNARETQGPPISISIEPLPDVDWSRATYLQSARETPTRRGGSTPITEPIIGAENPALRKTWEGQDEEAIANARAAGIRLPENRGATGGGSGWGGEEGRTTLDQLTGETGERYKLWPEHVVNSLVDAFKLPGDVLTGKTDPRAPETAGRAFELAGAVIFGPAPIARRAIDGTLGSIAGITAKTANKESLAHAHRLDARGFSAEEIWKATDWYKGTDGRWRFELPSNKATLVEKINDIRAMPTDSQISLDKFIKFPELFDAYPALKNVYVEMNHDMKFYGAAHADLGIIGINPTLIKQSGKSILKILLHEIQHFIQYRERFNPGSSTETALEQLKKHLKEAIIRDPRKMSELDAILPTIKQRREEIGDELYLRNPGEIEARLVESRSGWSDATRQSESPIGTMRRAQAAGSSPLEWRFPGER